MSVAYYECRNSSILANVEEPGHIASFALPPIVEVLTSVMFAPMPPEAFLSFGTFWRNRWAKSFPQFELQPPYATGVESFEQVRSRPAVEFNIEPTPPLPRIWMTSESGTQLLQMQNNWFAANWRRQPGGGEYIHWPNRREAFIQDWGELSAWLLEQGHQPIPSQCEVTYINHIAPIDGLWSGHSEVDKVIRAIPDGIGTVGLVPEQILFRLQQLIPEAHGLPPWRLHTTVTPAFGSADLQPIFVLELTARGAPGEGDGFLASLDRARRVIVESFVQLTTPSAREAWGQE